MKKMILIDSNSLLVLILGLMSPSLINKHEKTSIYEEEDFNNLLSIIDSMESILVLPNIWTEVDNLLNKRFKKGYKDLYVRNIVNLIKSTTEKYLASSVIEGKPHFYDLGLTDSLILEYSKECKVLITDDSQLSDYARAFGVNVYDMKYLRNQRLFKS